MNNEITTIQSRAEINLRQCSDEELIFELLERGYRIKVPPDQRPRETALLN
jgi:hypothetical protein